MSSSFPARLAGTRSKRELNMFPASPTGFILLGTTIVSISLTILHGAETMKLTSWVDTNDSNVESTEFGGQQFDEMVCCSFTCGVAGQVYVRCIMHTRARACQHDSSTTILSAQTSIDHGDLRSCGQKWKHRYRQEVMSGRVHRECIGPVRMP
jgi:hypothetical protein